MSKPLSQSRHFKSRKRFYLARGAVTGAAVAGGVINGGSTDLAANEYAAFTLTGDMLRRRLCADLQPTGGGEAEFRRRANEVAIILRAAGVSVALSA